MPPNRSANSTLILGHRGASGEAPENTLAAFRLALEQGAEGFELDVTLSADGVPVVIHDDTIDRTTNGTGEVARLTLSELKKLDAGSWKSERYAGERIPTLEEVFLEFGGRAVINVELKDDPSPDKRLAPHVVQLIQAHRLQTRVMVSSFYYDNVRRVKANDVTLAVGLLYDFFSAGPLLTGWLNGTLPPHEAHHPDYHLVNPLTMAFYRRARQRVNVWTVNDEAEMRRLARLGVDSLMTDFPAVGVRARQTSL